MSNGNYHKGDLACGIPHPGMIVVDTNGLVVGKLFLEAYSVRVDSGALLEFANLRVESMPRLSPKLENTE